MKKILLLIFIFSFPTLRGQNIGIQIDSLMALKTIVQNKAQVNQDSSNYFESEIELLRKKKLELSIDGLTNPGVEVETLSYEVEVFEKPDKTTLMFKLPDQSSKVNAIAIHGEYVYIEYKGLKDTSIVIG